MTKTTTILTMTILIAGVIAPALNNASVFAATNIVNNGSFEEPALPFGSWSAFYGDIQGWTLTFGPDIEIQNHVAGDPSTGDQFVELDGDSNSGISQTLTTTSGTYLLSFDFSPRPGVDAASNQIEVYWNGNLVDSITADGSLNGNTAWINHSYSVTATGSSTNLEFLATGVDDSLGGYIDSVSVILSACPEGYEIDGDTCVLSNQAPICDATSSVTKLWTPNHKMVSISLVGGSDPDGDPLTTTVTGVKQDEPTNAKGDGDKSPDATLSPLQVRSERSGTGDGRVYEISYALSDGNGGSCTGTVKVSVPHDVAHPLAVNSGTTFDSTLP